MFSCIWSIDNLCLFVTTDGVASESWYVLASCGYGEYPPFALSYLSYVPCVELLMLSRYLSSIGDCRLGLLSTFLEVSNYLSGVVMACLLVSTLTFFLLFAISAPN